MFAVNFIGDIGGKLVFVIALFLSLPVSCKCHIPNEVTRNGHPNPYLLQIDVTQAVIKAD